LALVKLGQDCERPLVHSLKSFFFLDGNIITISNSEGGKNPEVDVIIPVYGERSEALAATLSACLKQTFPVSRIFVVDDGSPEPVSLPQWAHSSEQINLICLSQNQGISAARNAAIARSSAAFLACVNSEVLPDADWLAICHSYLSTHPDVGACYTRVVPQWPDRLLTRWRMRFQEPKHADQSGPSEFAHGHAVLFRKEAVDRVGGYDVRYRRHFEDWDICQRMRKVGWESHYVARSRCVSIQEDSLKSLAAKQLRDSGWYSPAESSLAHLYLHLSKWTVVRASRNILKGRLDFLPVDAALWASTLWIATVRTLRYKPKNTDKSGDALDGRHV
jgi:cellulose synthase/poly-beta-1,6-N-acetylglucosamine synthase-like glycosyltransferase